MSVSAVLALLRRDILLAVRTPNEWINPLLFFVVVVTLFPLAISPEQKLLHEIGPGLIWIAALLSTFLNLDRLFRQDYEDGSLEQLLLAKAPLSLMVLGKIFAHWLITGLPLIIVTPLLGLFLYLSPYQLLILMLTLLLGTPILNFIGAIAAGITVGLRGSGVLLSLLVLPLYIPVLIFGTGCVVDAGMGLPVRGLLALLGAMLILALTLAPIAVSGALRVGIE